MADTQRRRTRLRMRVEAKAARVSARARARISPKGTLSPIRRFLRFAGSSFTCTVLDQLLAGILFLLLRKPMHDLGFLRIMVASVVARIFSQALNYALNHKLVFVGGTGGENAGAKVPRRPSRRESLPRFLAVATIILALSTVGVYLLNTYLDIQESVAKLLMDSGLFFVNYYLQRNWVFTTEPSINPRRARRKHQQR